MSFAQSVALGLALPPVLAGALLATAVRSGRGWLAAMAPALAYAAGHAALAWPAFPPLDVTDRIPWLALAAGMVGIAAARARSGRVRWPLLAVLIVLTLTAILGPYLREAVRSAAGVGWLAATVLAALGSWAAADRRLEVGPSGALAWPLVLIAGASAAALMLSGSATLGLCGGAMTAAAVGLALASRWMGVPTPDRGGLFAPACVLTALILSGHVYAGLPAPSALLLAAAPLAAWADRLGPARRLGPVGSATLRLAAVAVPLGVAVGLAVAASPAAEY